MSATNTSILGRLLATAVVGCSLIGFSGKQAHAASFLAGGPIWGGWGQTWAVCYVFNATGPSTFIHLGQIMGATAWVTNNTCTDYNMGTGDSCVVVANIAQEGAHWCRFIITQGDASSLRGALEIRDANGVILNSVELR